MEDREDTIKNQLKQIAQMEMKKGKDEDEMLDMTLKAIEIVNIADMVAEKENLDSQVETLVNKKNELDKLEEDLMREKTKNINKLRGNSNAGL